MSLCTISNEYDIEMPQFNLSYKAVFRISMQIQVKEEGELDKKDYVTKDLSWHKISGIFLFPSHSLLFCNCAKLFLLLLRANEVQSMNKQSFS